MNRVRERIYLDNAATTAHKPQQVVEAHMLAATKYTANPGRGSYDLSEQCSRAVYDARRNCAEFFGIENPENVVFTPGCTFAINYAIKGCVRPGTHIVISDLEHNAVARTVHSLKRFGVEYTAARVYEGDFERTAKSFRDAVRRNTCMVVCTHASNVFGTILPINEISQMCTSMGIPMCVDAAQTAGVMPVDKAAHGADFVCVPGHKGLHGMCGAGILAVTGDVLPVPMITGGTGSLSSVPEMPHELPDRLESGTGNTAGILAMSAGISWVRGVGIEKIRRHETELAAHVYEGLAAIDGVRLYSMPPAEGTHAPIVSFNINNMQSETVARMLDEEGICVRAGYHCAYMAHRAYKTLESGTVRVSPGCSNTHAQIDSFLDAVYKISKNN